MADGNIAFGNAAAQRVATGTDNTVMGYGVASVELLRRAAANGDERAAAELRKRQLEAADD